MPRCLGRDYYHEDHAVRRELSMHATLIVPRRIKSEEDNYMASHLLDVHRTVVQELKSSLEKLDVTNDSDSLQFDLQSFHTYDCVVEPLEWATKWKNFDGNYIEIVPSSNPESNSSFYDSYPDSQRDSCSAEDYYTVPVRELCKGNDGSRQLEEPLLLKTLNLRHLSHIWRLGSIMASLTPDLVLDPSLNEQHNMTPGGRECPLEESVFGNSDQQLQVTLISNTAHINIPVEDFQEHVFEQVKAEELICPLIYDETTSDSPRMSVSKACKLCSTDPVISPLLPTPDRYDADAGTADMKDLVREQLLYKEYNLESLLVSPVAKTEPCKFLDLNSATDRGLLYKHPDIGLESPLYLHSGPLPSSFDLASNSSCVSSLMPWSPHLLSANSNSPFLSDHDFNKIQTRTWQSQAIFGLIQDLKLCEPEMKSQEDETTQHPNPVTAGLHLATTAQGGRSLGQLELDLNWDVSPVSPKLLSHTCLERFTVVQEVKQKSLRWKTSLDIETIEDIVERQVLQKPPTDFPNITSDQAISKIPVRLRTNQNEVCVDNKHLNAISNAGSLGNIAIKDYNARISTENLVSMDNLTSSPITTLNEVGTFNIGNTMIVQPKVSTCGNDANVQMGVNFLTSHLQSQNLSLRGAIDQRAAPNLWMNQTTRDLLETDRDLQPSVVIKQHSSQDHKTNLLPDSCAACPVSTYNSRPSAVCPVSTYNSRPSAVCPVSTYNSRPSAVCPVSTYNSRSSAVCQQAAQHCAMSKSYQYGDGESCSAETPADLYVMVGSPLKKCIQTKEKTPDGFNLLLDDDEDDKDALLGSDFSSYDNGSQENVNIDVDCMLSDPVDHFLMLRDAKATNESTIKGQTVMKAAQKPERTANNPHPGIITPMSVIPHGVNDNEQRFVTVSLSGQFLKALQDIVSQADLHLHRLRTERVLSSDVTVMSLKPDYTRYLLKDRINKLGREQQDLHQDETYKDLLVVHTLRLAAHLLEHCCLESAIIHLAHAKDKCPAIAGTVEGLRKSLFKHQFTAQQTGQLHPKVAAVCREIQQHKRTTGAPYRVLVVVRREHPTMVTTLQSAISADGTLTKMTATESGHWPDECECLIIWDQAVVKALVLFVTLVVEFEASDRDTQLSKECEADNVSYVGLAVITKIHNLPEFGKHHSLAQLPGRVEPCDNDAVTVVGSQQLIQQQQLLQLLESRHNVVIVTRDYLSAGLMHYPDMLVDLVRGAVLVPVHHLRDPGGMEGLLERLTAVGLHLSTIWVLVYCQHDLQRNLFEHKFLKKLVQLQSLVANISGATKGFITTYKVLLCQTAEQVALYVSHLAVSSKAAHPSNVCPNANMNQLPTEMTKEERFLLNIPCLNPFSCHLLLSRTSVGQALRMSHDQLQDLLPELPSNVIENFYRVVTLDRGLHLRPELAYLSQPHDRNAPQLSPELDSPSQLGTLPCLDLNTTPHRFDRNMDQVDEDKAVLFAIQDLEPSLSPISQSARAGQCLKGEESDVVSPVISLPNSQRNGHSTDHLIPSFLPPIMSPDFYSTRSGRIEEYRNLPASSTSQRGGPHNASHPSMKKAMLGDMVQKHEVHSPVSSINAYPKFVFNHCNQCKQNNNNSDVRCLSYKTTEGEKTDLFPQHHSFTPDPTCRNKLREADSRISRQLACLGRGECRPGSTFSDASMVQWGGTEALPHQYIQRNSTFSRSGTGLPPPLSLANNELDGLPCGRPHHYGADHLDDSTDVSDLHNLGKETNIPHSGTFSTHISKEKACAYPMFRDSLASSPKQRFDAFPASTMVRVVPTHSHVGAHSSFQRQDSCLLPPRNVPHRESTDTFHRPVEGFAGQDRSFSLRNVDQTSSFCPSYWQACDTRYPESQNHAGESGQHSSHLTALSAGFRDFKTGCLGATSNDQESAVPLSKFRGTAMGTSECERLSAEGISDIRKFPTQLHERFTNEPSGNCVSSVKNNFPDSRALYDGSEVEMSSYSKPSAEPPSPYGRCRKTECGKTSSKNLPPEPLHSLGMRYSHSEFGHTESAQVSKGNSDTSRFRPSFNDNLAATTRRLLSGRMKSPDSSEHRSQLHSRTPLTPSHCINIGLATPIHRNNAPSQSSADSGAGMTQQPPNLSHSQTSSPPLDMDMDVTDHHRKQGVSAAKLQKWSAQLQAKGKHHLNCSSDNFSGDPCPSVLKKRAMGDRKLSYQPVPGAGGQTRLTFI